MNLFNNTYCDINRSFSQLPLVYFISGIGNLDNDSFAL